MKTFWLLLKAILTLVPLIVEAIKEQKIKTASQDEILSILSDEFEKRIAAAIKAGMEEPISETLDPNNRDNR